LLSTTWVRGAAAVALRIYFDTGELRALSADLDAGTATVEAKTKLAVAKVGHLVEADAKVFVPVRTGNLKGSIHTEVSGLTAEVSANTEYAVFVEHGTSRMRPQPYMGPALDKNAPVLEKAVEKIGGGIL
jgi:HK97 gp10 family phage protein